MSESMLITFIRFVAGVCVMRADVSTLIVRKYLESYIEGNYGKRMVNQCVTKFDVFLNRFKARENNDLILHSICTDVT